MIISKPQLFFNCTLTYKDQVNFKASVTLLQQPHEISFQNLIIRPQLCLYFSVHKKKGCNFFNSNKTLKNFRFITDLYLFVTLIQVFSPHTLRHSHTNILITYNVVSRGKTPLNIMPVKMCKLDLALCSSGAGLAG